ncbi:hypothetical protein B0H14DRAFT_1628817 [Mycena olivaceomarginata]|nr:hypothetical protein B0H14DRAFT_1628817 [Mycena olivaceomarginata]
MYTFLHSTISLESARSASGASSCQGAREEYPARNVRPLIRFPLYHIPPSYQLPSTLHRIQPRDASRTASANTVALLGRLCPRQRIAAEGNYQRFFVSSSGQIPGITHGKMARQRAKLSILSSRFQVLVQPQKFKKIPRSSSPPILYFKLLSVLLAFPILAVGAYDQSSSLPLPTAGLVEA